MVSKSCGARRARFAGMVGALGVVAGLVLWMGGNNNTWRGLKDGGDARFVSFEPLPEVEGMMCEFEPASASAPLTPRWSPLQDGAPPPRPSEAEKAAGARRAPVRTIRDPGPVYSAVALDLTHDEVVMQDENTWSIMVYNRTENTPPTARLTEPKRWIKGDATGLEFNCSLYIDPVNGDIYSVNNDTKNLLMVFSHEANGNVAPKRLLKAPYFYGIAMDEERQEMFLSAQGHIVAVWRKNAQGLEAPLRFIKGNSTKLADPHGMALDPKRGELFVANWGVRTVLETPYVTGDIPWGDGRLWGGEVEGGLGRSARGMGVVEPPSITIYRKDAMGDAAPLRVIQGSKTQLNWPTAIAVDSENGEIYVANDTGHSVTVYDITANGDVAPKRVISGGKSLIKNPTGVAYDAKHNEVWVANFGNHTATVFPRTAHGDAQPLRVIRSAPLDQQAPMMGNPHVLIYNDKRDELFVAQ